MMSERDHSVPEPYVIAKSRSQHKRVKLNVGGIRYTYLQHPKFAILMLDMRSCGRSFILSRIPSLECWQRLVVMINYSHWQMSNCNKINQAKTHEEIIQLCDDYSLVNNEYFFDR